MATMTELRRQSKPPRPPAGFITRRRAETLTGISHGRLSTLVVQSKIRSVADGDRVFVHEGDVREYAEAVARLASFGTDRAKAQS
jgi:hypothetical protein